jgi:hypothetical protein
MGGMLPYPFSQTFISLNTDFICLGNLYKEGSLLAPMVAIGGPNGFIVTACAVHRITCEALKGPAPVYSNKPVIPQAYVLPFASPKVDSSSSFSLFSVNRRISFGSWLCSYFTGRRRDIYGQPGKALFAVRRPQWAVIWNNFRLQR